MGYRIQRNGFVIEADTVDDVQALIAALDKPLLPMMQERRAAAKPAKRSPRGTSDGALDGRILSALDAGALSPGVLCDRVKAERYNVNMALRGLVDRGVVRVEGATSKRRITLAKAPKPKEALQ